MERGRWGHMPTNTETAMTTRKKSSTLKRFIQYRCKLQEKKVMEQREINILESKKKQQRNMSGTLVTTSLKKS
jgi:hypothetical protein